METSEGVIETADPPRVVWTPPPGRYRGPKRLLGAVVGMLIVAVLGAGLVHNYRTWALPDAPEPFDVAAFEAEPVPLNRNGYVYFKSAEAMLGSTSPDPFAPLWMRREVDWTGLTPEARAWFDRNRAALDVWRDGTDRPDAAWPKVVPDPDGTVPPSRINLIGWSRFARIEASRHEDAGDLDRAWTWHKARIRYLLLATRRTGLVETWGLSHALGETISRTQLWADLPEITIPTLRRAIADLEAARALIGRESDAVKLLYLQAMAALAHPDELHGLDGRPAGPALGVARPTAPGMLRPIARRLDDYLHAEPERSKRAVRLIFANWLAQADKPAAGRTKVVSSDPLIFEADPGATPPLAPVDLAAFVRSSRLAMDLSKVPNLGVPGPRLDALPGLNDANRRAVARLIVGLASRIYEIERGSTPADPEALVGTVLPRLPDDYQPPDSEAPPAPRP